MVGIAPQRSNFFVRSNYAIGLERERQRERTAVEKEKQSLLGGTQSVLSLTEQAVGKIERGAHADAALRELWAFLLELRHLRASDPGIRMAAQDLYEAAGTLAMHQRAGGDVADIRLLRLLKQANARLRMRLGLVEQA